MTQVFTSGLLSAYKGLKPKSCNYSIIIRKSLLSAYKGLKQKVIVNVGVNEKWFIKCL